jgi:hypothetical protein
VKRKYVVKKKMTLGQRTFRKWEDWEVGDILIGKYVSQGTDQYDKPSYVIEVYEAQFKDKKAAKVASDGINLCLNSCGMLDKAMEGVEFGEVIQVEYTGTATIEKGKYKGKESHMMDVMVVEEEGDEEDLDEDTEEEDDEEEEEESDEDESEDEEDEDEDEEEEKPAPKKKVKKK